MDLPGVGEPGMPDIGTIQSTWENLSALLNLRSMVDKPDEGEETKRH